MRHLLIALLLLAASPALAQAPLKLAKQAVDPTVSISVPETFKRLTGEQAQVRSLSARSPMAVFVDPAGDADLVVNEAHAFFDASDLAIMKDFYKANIRNFYNKVTFLKESFEPVSGKKGIVFEFTAEVTEKGRPTLKKYVQAHYGLRKRRVIVATFTSDEKSRQKWAKTATAALNTLKITEK